MSTTLNTPKKSRKASTKRAGVTRHPAFTALENAIISDGVKNGGLAKAAVIKLVRDWESRGLDAATIAGAMRFSEGTDAFKGLGKPQPTDADAQKKFQSVAMGLDNLDSGNANAEELDQLLASLDQGGEDADDDSEDRDEDGLGR